MSNKCKNGKNHEWSHPQYDVDHEEIRICLFCKVVQTRVIEWRVIENE